MNINEHNNENYIIKKYTFKMQTEEAISHRKWKGKNAILIANHINEKIVGKFY